MIQKRHLYDGSQRMWVCPKAFPPFMQIIQVLLRGLIAVEHIMAPEMPTSKVCGEGNFSGVWGKLSIETLVLTRWSESNISSANLDSGSTGNSSEKTKVLEDTIHYSSECYYFVVHLLSFQMNMALDECLELQRNKLESVICLYQAIDPLANPI